MPPSTKPAPLKFVLTTTSLRNVTIATAADEFYYEIVTPDWDSSYTKIRRLDSESGQVSLIAELKREKSRSDCTGLRFVKPDQADEDEKVFSSPEEFLSLDPNATGGKVIGSFTGENGKRYRWQEVKGSIELVGADETEGKRLARFHKHHRHLGVLRLSEKPYIDIEPELTETINTVIVSFLIAEGKRRRS